MQIALVGGGKAAVTILNYFRLFREHQVIGVADLKSDAPGIVRARELKINTTTDMESLIRRENVDLVIEITGNAGVQERIRGMLRSDQQMVTAGGAKLMTDLIAAQTEQNAAVAEGISQSFGALTNSLEHTITDIDGSFRTIERLLREANIISINANIEAARAGSAGKPFEVVVQRIGEMVRQIQEASDTIGQASRKTHDTLKDLGRVEKRLQKSFHAGAGNDSDLSEQ